ncbi:hypothetical protein CFIMG_000912RAa, partial [Ceratocystis fimbriata CBS 114723]
LAKLKHGRRLVRDYVVLFFSLQSDSHSLTSAISTLKTKHTEKRHIPKTAQ